MSKLTLRAEVDRQILVTRAFAAPPELVYRAHTEAGIIQKWLLGPEGWTMPSCVCDARPGGSFRYEWAHETRGRFHITGEFLELVPFSRIRHVERMFLPDPTPDNHVETRFEPQGTGTFMTLTMTLPDGKTRATMLATGMEQGMEASYARFEASLAAAGRAGRYEVLTVQPLLTAAVKFSVAFADMPKAEQTARASIAATLPGLGITPGQTCTLCRMLDDGRMHYEPGVIVGRAFAAAGDVIPSQLPGGRVVKYTLVGSFEQLPQAWPALFAWCQENGLRREGWFWQIYEPPARDPAAQATHLYALLA